MKITNLVVWLTERCNLSCLYCYETHRPIELDLEKVKNAIMLLFQRDSMNLRAEQHRISFFGGEPLLEYENMVQLIEWLETAIPRPFRYSITTNGTLIDDEKARYLAGKHFGMLFSIDGDREAMLARSDSYDASIAALQHVWAAGLSPEANMTFRVDQLGRATTNIQHVVDLGFHAYNLNHQVGVEYEFTDLYNAFLTVYRYHMEHLHPQVKTSALQQPFRSIELRERQASSCGAGKGFVAISPVGEIYPCHKMVQIPATKLAEYGKSISGQLKGWWEHFDMRQNEVCQQCAVLPLCRGGCAVDNALFCGDFHRPYNSGCTFTRARLTAAQTIYWECSEQERREVLGVDNAAVCAGDNH
jgi:uncharacterized protein